MTDIRCFEATGEIKFFPEKAPYRFVGTASEGDVYVPPSLVRQHSCGLPKGAQVRVWATQIRDDKKPEVTKLEIIMVAEPAKKAKAAMKRVVPETRPTTPATVKWFNGQKGYGFVNIDGQPGDVFVHMSVCAEGIFGRNLREGAKVFITLDPQPRKEGKMSAAALILAPAPETEQKAA